VVRGERRWVGVVGLWVGAMLAVAGAMGQVPSAAATEKPVAFDVVSIRRSKPPNYPGAGGGAAMSWQMQPDGYRTVNQTIWATIMIAYFPEGMANWTPERLKGGPDWIVTEQYDINAKVSAADLPAWQRQGTTLEHQEMFRAMMKTMLAERCKMVAHTVPAEEPGLVLAVGKRGVQFKPTPVDETIPSGGMPFPGGGTAINDDQGRAVRFYGATMEQLAQYMALFSYPRLPVEDQTGLTGRYDLVLHRPDAGSSTDDDSGSTSYWDVRALGLEFRQVKRPTVTLVIDHIERPSEN
jgi:uncharacterized protein (TIGR03435 family)